MTSAAPIRLLTIDSLPVVHAGVRQLLAPFPDIEIVGAARDHSEALQLGAGCAPTLILVEIEALGADWPAALRWMSAALRAAVVVFTQQAEGGCVRQALGAGVQGFLLKNTQPLALAQALRSIAAGQRVFAPEVMGVALTAEPHEALGESLTQREREVLALLARGLSNREIGLRLSVSNATVKFHCSQLFSKLGVSSRAQAVAAAFTRDLVPRVVAEREQPVAPQSMERYGHQARSA